MTARALDAATRELVRRIFEEKIPFNRTLGLGIESMTYDRATVSLGMRDDLVGNYVRASLHGGVIAATLDLTGGLVCFLGLLERLRDEPSERKMARLAEMGTIDLRVDYLRPGVGRRFLTTGFRLRTGSRVSVARMEMHGEDDRLVAVGTGAYIVG